MKVTALLVSHNGSRWLPGVLAGLSESTRPVDRLVAVDTGSADDSVGLVEQALGLEVVRLPATASYAEAVRTALVAAPSTGRPDGAEDDAQEWVWLLHDDCSPAPECLQVLVEGVDRAGSKTARKGADEVVAVGPKLREWPTLKRLLEVGLTISGTGKRETGLEAGEYDQGQHDVSHQVMAVNTAGMLVRRDVLESLGFDDRLPIFGNDIDFGWRLARAGYATLVVPDAVMFHAEAAHRGQRDSALVGRPRRHERAAALYTLLVSAPAWTVPVRAVRLLAGGLLRVLGFVFVRAGGEARDELAALGRVYARPGAVLAGRRARRGLPLLPGRRRRRLLAPVWLPYRHGLDFVTEVGTAVASTAREAVVRRNSSGTSGRPDPDEPGTPGDRGVLATVLASPSVLAVLAAVVLALVAGRDILTGPPLQGGALLPAPDGVGHWWGAWHVSVHMLGAGSAAPAPAYLLPMAVLGTVLLGHPGWVVSLLFVLAVPLAMFSALRLLRRLTDRPWAPLWGASAYALLPVVSGAANQGRLGTVAGAVVAPWVVTAALGLGSPDVERRWRAAFRTAFALGVLVAFVPVAWLLALLSLVAMPLLARRLPNPAMSVVLAVLPLALVAPWAIATLDVPGAWLVEAGRAGAVPVHPGYWDLLLGRPGGPGAAPAWIGIGLPLAGLVALVRRDTRAKVTRVWVGIALVALLLAVVSRIEVTLPGLDSSFLAWPGFLVLLMQGGFVLAATIAADGVGLSWRRPVAAVVFVMAMLAPLAGVVWWVGHGGLGPVGRPAVAEIPAYMSELGSASSLGGVLVLTGGDRTAIRFRLLRSGPLRLGDDGVLALTRPDQRLTVLVGRLLSADLPDDAAKLASYGVSYVYAPAPVSASVSGGLDAANGISGASAPAAHARAWHVDARPTLGSVHTSPSPLHPLLLVVQLLTALGVLIGALPGRRAT
ncbi:MAG: glycosyltransferase [Actinomycetota bacterium]|nr:glycosyltransferase [Actinomycetota bacterium]